MVNIKAMRWLHKLLTIVLLLAVSGLLHAQSPKLARHARNAPDSLNYDLPALTTYLTAPAKTEREKAYVLYTWITYYLTYDKEADRLDRRLNRTVGDILRRRKGVCFDYATLFERLCYYAGLTCYQVDGYADATLAARALPDTPNHSWNALKLDGQWQLLDATWGDVQDELASKYNTDYFLTPPRLFILNHLPANPVWQLLECPIAPASFEKGADVILSTINAEEHCPSYSDSLQHYLELAPKDQRLAEAEATYRFYPTEGNRRFYAHALIDRAILINRQADSLKMTDQLAEYVDQLDEAEKLIEQAVDLSPLYDWQTEMHAGLLINQAVALSRMEYQEQRIRRAIRKLEQAQELLKALPEDNYYRQYAEKQTSSFLNALKDY